MSEENGSKGCSIAVVWLVLLAILGGAVWFLYTKPKNEQLNQDTGSSSQYTHELSIAADLFSGYAVLRSAQMRDNLKSDGIRLTMVDDGADYGARLEALEDGDVQMAVYTIDSLMMAGAKAGSFPASIVMLIDETKGADAVLAYKSAVASLHDLDDSTARFVLTPSSPSEFLARVVKSHFQLPNLSGDWMIEADGAAAVLKKMKSAKQSDKTSIHSDKDNGLSVTPQRVGTFTQRIGCDPVRLQQRYRPQHNVTPIHQARHTVADLRAEVRHRRSCQSAVVRRVGHRGRERVFAATLDRRSRRQQFGLGRALGREHGRQDRSSLGQGARLVDHNRADALECLERLGIFDEYTDAGATSGADHDGHRRR